MTDWRRNPLKPTSFTAAAFELRNRAQTFTATEAFDPKNTGCMSILRFSFSKESNFFKWINNALSDHSLDNIKEVVSWH